MTWFDEQLHGAHRQGLKVDAVLYDSETEHQRLQVFQNPQFGRFLTLDGVVQTTEGDEFIYHEMMAHTPIIAHGNARRVLIIGGGDGGMAREVLRHDAVEHVTMVEIDAGVVEFSKEYLPTLSAGAFDDPRLSLVIADGAEFVKTSEDQFDVIIVDSTDPIGPGEVLFTDHFYGHARARLKEGGVLVTQNGVPFMQPDELRDDMKLFKEIFEDYACYLGAVPSYAGGFMAFGWGCDNDRRRLISEKTLLKRFREAELETRYYTPSVHKAAFALPRFIQDLMPQKKG